MPSHKIRFGRDVLIAAVATALKSLRNLLLIRFISFNLSLADYGVWEQIAVGMALILPWITLQLPSALLRFLPGHDDLRRWADDFLSVFTFVVATTAGLGMVLLYGLELLAPYPHLAPFAAHAALIAWLFPTTAAVNTVVILLRARRLMFIHSILTLAQNFGEFALTGYLLSQGHDLGAAILSLVLVRGLIALAGLCIAHTHFGLARPTFSRLREYLTYTMPLVPNSSLYRVFDAGDRYVLSYFTSHAAVGIYAAAYTMGSFFTTLIGPINMVLLPVMAEFWNQRREAELGEYMTQAIRYSTLLSLPALAGAIYLAPRLLAMLMADTDQAVPYFRLISCSFLIFGIGILGSNLLVTAGRTRLLLSVDFTLATSNLLLNLLFVPAMGIMGAVVATLMSHIAYATIVLYKAHQIAPFRLPVVPVVHSAAGAGCMIGCLYLTSALFGTTLVLQVGLGAAVYAVFMVASGGIERRELRFFANVVKGLTPERGDDGDKE